MGGRCGKKKKKRKCLVNVEHGANANVAIYVIEGNQTDLFKESLAALCC